MLRSSKQNRVSIDSSDTTDCLLHSSTTSNLALSPNNNKDSSVADSKPCQDQLTDSICERDDQEAIERLNSPEQHARSRSLTSLHNIFSRQHRPHMSRSLSQLSAHSDGDTLSSSSSSIETSSSKESNKSTKLSTFSKIIHLFPIKGNNNKSLSGVGSPVILSKKSLEFEALLEEFPTRTIKTSLTPCTAA